MKFAIKHTNFNVADMDKSVAFYEKALGMKVVRTHEAKDGSFMLKFLGDEHSGHQLELTCLKDHPQPYELGENEIHLCFATDDYDGAHALHESMGCICYENENMGLYFIEDPDGYWLEIVKEK